MRRNDRKEIKAAADELVTRLKEAGIRIQRYDAYSSNSVYLKLDYGVLNSIRISDHHGKKHLAYRYNLLTNLNGNMKRVQGNFERFFFSARNIEGLLEKILTDRTKKLAAYGRGKYRHLMMVNLLENENNTKGFWAKAVEV